MNSGARKMKPSKGWNLSGPVEESRALKAIVKDLEEKVTERLREEKQG
jgi:hypothetical protein